MFILCTTEVHKLPETIVSRCVRVQFTKATSAELARSISRVIRGEKVKVTPEAISYIADHVDGSFRDGVKVLDQLLATGEEVTEDLVKQAMGGIVGYTSLPFVEAMLAHDATLSLQLFHQAISAGSDLIYFLTSAMKTLRDGLLAPYGIGESVLKVPVFATELITKMDIVARGIGTAVMPELLVEVMIVEWCGESANQRTSTPAKQQVSESVDQNVSVSENVVQNVAPITKVEGTELRSMWRQMMSTMDKANYSLEALLSKAWPARVEGGELVIQVSHDFHKTQLETARFRNQIDGMVVAAFGQPLVVRFEVGRENLPGEVESANISELEQIFIN